MIKIPSIPWHNNPPWLITLKQWFCSTPVKFSLIAFISVRVLLSIWGFVLWKMGWVLPLPTDKVALFFYGDMPVLEGFQGALFGVWQRWDALHYIAIVRDGYLLPNSSAFFPLYPMLGKFVSHLTNTSALISLIIVSNVFLFLSCILLFKITASIFDEQTAGWAVIAMLIYPFSVFLFAPYTESLALFLILSCYLYLRKRNWNGITIAGFLSGLSRGTVFPMVSLIAFDAFLDGKKIDLSNTIQKAIATISPILGIGTFLVWRMIAGLPPFNELLYQAWGRRFSYPWQTVSDLYAQFVGGRIEVDDVVNLIMLIFVIFVFVLSARRLPKDLIVYEIVFLAFSLSTPVENNVLDSWGRYSLLIFPTYMGIAAGLKTPAKKLTFLAIFLLLVLIVSGFFFLWGWIG